MKFYLRRFTLIELMVILSIIATLTGLLIPALNVAWEKTESIQCQKGLEQVNYSLQLYAADNRGHVPFAYGRSHPNTDYKSWNSVAYTYLLNNPDGAIRAEDLDELNVLCPSADQSKPYQFTTYAINAALGGYPWDYSTGVEEKPCNIYLAKDTSEVFMVGEKNPNARGGCFAIFKTRFPVIYKQWEGAYDWNVSIRHNGGGNWLYIDGHVDWQDSDKVWSDKELGRDATFDCY